MSTLVLVRHGQASFGAGHYDALSAQGQRQVERLRDYWQQRGERFDEVWSGSLRRQLESARAAGEPRVDARWNEYDNEGILTHLAPQLAGTAPEFAGLYAAHRAAPADPKAFQRMFEPLMLAWQAGEVRHPAVEPWEVFQARVEAALRAVVEQPGSRRVVVFTSGGPIGAAVRIALSAPERQALALNWRVRNGSLTTFVYSPGRLTLDQFNATPHLEPGDETYR